MALELKFETPPNLKEDARATNAEIAAALRKKPNEWAVIYRLGLAQHGAASVRASGIKNGKPAAFAPAGSFDAVARAVDGEWRVYARFVGKAE